MKELYFMTISWTSIMLLFSFSDTSIDALRFRIVFTNFIMFVLQYFIYIRKFNNKK
jgi:hypothetical protein